MFASLRGLIVLWLWAVSGSAGMTTAARRGGAAAEVSTENQINQAVLSKPGTGQSKPPRTATTSLVDVLSSDADFSLFIRLLQRARLIPTLNRLANATIFAPTNDAVRKQQIDGPDADMLAFLEAEFDDDDDDDDESVHVHVPDNLQYRLRERLFYHMLNYTLDWSSIDSAADRPGYQTTLLFPTTHEAHGRPGHAPYPEPEDTLLGGEGQKIVIRSIDSSKIASGRTDKRAQSPSYRIGVDEFGEGGASTISDKGGLAKNGQVVAIDAILAPPKSLAHQIKARVKASQAASPSGSPALGRFANLLTEEIWSELQNRSHITLFAPRDEAFDVLDPLEWRYLESGFAQDDILQISQNHESEFSDSGRERVGYIDRLLETRTVPLLSGDPVSVADDKGRITVNGSTVQVANVLASNGVMHIVDSLLLPYGSLALTPEKYLIALNATRFISLFRNANLAHLLQSSPHNPENNGSYTILATKDDVLERASQLPWSSLPPDGSKELSEALKYHVLEGKWTKKQLKDGQLLKTMLSTSGLGDAQQRIPVSVSQQSASSSSSSSSFSSSKSKSSKNDNEGSDIGFGNANVIAEPVDVGNCVIYLISKVLEPPSNFVSVALDRGLSTFVAAVYSAGLDKHLLHQSPATTFFSPTNTAFDYLGLAMNYFLLSSAKDELGQLLKYHAIGGQTLYLSERDLQYDSERFTTLEGSDVYLDRRNATSHVHLRGPTIGGFPANGDTRDGRIVDEDLLTSTGVLQVVDQVEIPPTLNITSEKLMRGGKANTFPDLLRMANLSWIAQGQSGPPEGFTEYYPPFIGLSKSDRKKIQKELFRHTSYTILCPTDRAFTRVNLTRYLNDPAALLALVQLHIIPSPPPSKSSISDPTRFPSDGRPINLMDESSFSTLLSRSQGGTSRYGDVAFRRAGESDWLVGIKGARGTDGKHDAARVLSHGRNTPIFSTDDDDDDDNDDEISIDGVARALGRPRMVFGGGVLLIDGVLEPYNPGWMQRWGYIVVMFVICLLASAVIGALAWKLWERRKHQGAHYETLRQENEED